MAKPKKLIRKTYLSAVQNSVGCKTFRNFFVEYNGETADVMQNGHLSCAYFVSGLLSMFNLIEAIHGTVENTVNDLEDSGWVKAARPDLGDVVVWEAVDFGDGDIHKHIGFYIGDNLAVSNDINKGFPEKHDWTFKGLRKVETIYRLEKESDYVASKQE